ncbi:MULTISPECIES: TraB/VirB10 family protein [Legionella]|uniref:TraB/VirB10 family protein n=2 Tax=Legionella TaxID=445 RepID=A0A9X2CYF6_9GAMM|nr:MULTISPECIES: TraB/VirB10 family protein [Legionella]KTC80126.1 putative conjugative transfer protein TraB [Legionella cherrii]MCL9682833.1 TraB/VirB10 family protein [Legionella maioricensis]MCL9686539.1 TraB/VirB10 family protein [Legionella maioricensis]
MSIQLKKQQQILLGVVIGVIVLVIACFALLGNKTAKPKEVDKPAYKKHSLASPISSSTNESHWIEKTQNAWRTELAKSELLDKNIKALGDEKDKQGKLISSQKDELSELRATLSELKHQIVKLQMERTTPVNEASKNNGLQNGLLPQADEAAASNSIEIDSGFIQYTAKLSKKSKPRIKTPSNYVFSNTFAKAVVLQGADASAGVLSQANPDIMIFQIVEDGIMPNKYRTPLKGCMVSASVIGDISSERGKFRTERLSCIHSNGTNLDIQVTGIISDSKNGIRGRAVWRDEPMVKKAFWGNFWESMGNIGQQYSTDYSTSALGSVATIQPGKIPLAAVSSGGSGASKMYAQYNIKRAEMYHPIIQLPPLVTVDVTFLKGFWLDGGTDTNAPEQPEESQNTESPSESETAEEKAANQFFYKNHSF